MAGFLDFLSDPRFLSQVGTSLQAAGGTQVTLGYLANGMNAKAQADFQATQLRQQANDAMGSAQRKAWSDDRATKYLASETLARAAAGGGGASDPTVVHLIAQQAAEGSYRKQVDLYDGESRSHQLSLQADAKEFEGNATQANDRSMAATSALRVGSTLLTGYARDSSLFQRFGNGGPKLPTDLANWSGY